MGTLKNYTEKSRIFIKNIIENKSHSFKIKDKFDSWSIIFIECTNCKCIIQLNYKSGETMFSVNENETPILFNEHLTCEEVVIKKMLE